MKIESEFRGQFDYSQRKNNFTITNELYENRIAIFLNNDEMISIAVDLPNNCGTRCYSLTHEQLLEIFRNYENQT